MKNKKISVSKSKIWQVARRPTGAVFEDGGRQDIILWVERSGRVRQMTMVDAESDWESGVSQSLSGALKSPMAGCQAGRPDEIQVDDERMMSILGGYASSAGIRLTLQNRLDLLNEFYQMLLENLEQGPGFAYLEGTSVQAAEVDALARETIAYLEARPFDEIDGDDILRLEGLNVSPLYVSVLGFAGMEYGLGVYFSRETAVAYLGGITQAQAASLPALSLTLVEEEDCPPLLDVEIRMHGWPCHPMGFPLLMRMDGDRGQPNSQEIRLVIDCLEAVRHFAVSEKEGSYSFRGLTVRVEYAQLSAPSPLAQLIFSNLGSGPDSPTKSKSKSKSKSKR